MSLKTTLSQIKKAKSPTRTDIPAVELWYDPALKPTRAAKIKNIKTDFSVDFGVIVDGATAKDFNEFPTIPADISVQELNNYDGKATWIKKITSLKKTSRTLLVISGMDTVSVAEQEKFIPLLKDRYVDAYLLPDNVQVVMPVSNLKKVSPKIREFSIALKV